MARHGYPGVIDADGHVMESDAELLRVPAAALPGPDAALHRALLPRPGCLAPRREPRRRRARPRPGASLGPGLAGLPRRGGRYGLGAVSHQRASARRPGRCELGSGPRPWVQRLAVRPISEARAGPPQGDGADPDAGSRAGSRRAAPYGGRAGHGGCRPARGGVAGGARPPLLLAGLRGRAGAELPAGSARGAHLGSGAGEAAQPDRSPRAQPRGGPADPDDEPGAEWGLRRLPRPAGRVLRGPAAAGCPT